MRFPIGIRRLPAAIVAVVLVVVVGTVVFLWWKGPFGGDGCGDEDVARGRTASASSTETDEMSEQHITDGDAGTRWSSVWGDPQYVQVDLGEKMPVCRIVMKWESAYASAYDLQVSDDGEKWAAIYTTTNGAGGNESVQVKGEGRYVRVLMRARATSYGYSMWDLEVYSGERGDEPVNPQPKGATSESLLSYRKPAEASSTRDAASCSRCDAARVNDQDKATQWMTGEGASGEAWVRVDLGATAQVHQVDLVWGGEYAKAYAIQTSPDGETWTDVATNDTGDGGTDSVKVNGSGRYVRMLASAGVSSDGYSLWEMQVYGTAGAPIAPPEDPDSPSEPYELVWGDDFDGAAGSEPNPEKWRADLGPGVTGELQYYTDNKNVQLDGDGNLVITAKREVTAGSTCPRDPVSKSTTCQYTSGRLNTSGLFSFTYGRVEARIKVAGTPGLWPAFWMLGEELYTGQKTWPYAGEVDIMEHVGRAPGESSATLHAGAYNGADGIGGTYHTDVDLSKDFHVYAVDWSHDRITFSVDGNDFFTADREIVEKERGPWVYDRPFVILLNNAVGGPYAGPPGSDTKLPIDMVVDYVHVYR